MKVLNDKLLKNDALKGQPQDVVKLLEKIDTLKKTLAIFFGGSEYLNKLLRYNRIPMAKFGHRYKRKKFVHDKFVTICYFCGKVGYMWSKCKDLP